MKRKGPTWEPSLRSRPENQFPTMEPITKFADYPFEPTRSTSSPKVTAGPPDKEKESTTDHPTTCWNPDAPPARDNSALSGLPIGMASILVPKYSRTSLYLTGNPSHLDKQKITSLHHTFQHSGYRRDQQSSLAATDYWVAAIELQSLNSKRTRTNAEIEEAVEQVVKQKT